MLSQSDYTVCRLSEGAVVIQFESVIHDEMLARVLAFQKNLVEKKFDGFIECVPSYCSLTLYYDPVQVTRSSLAGNSAWDKVSSFLSSLKVEPGESDLNPVPQTVPVCYDLKYGLDLPELSKSLGLTPGEIVNIHSQRVYSVYLIGFAPGFPYMGRLAPELECKRKSYPRKKVPAGSVAIAGKQTGIYPFETPGGWQIIGRTPSKLFSVEWKQPSLFKPGDKVKFEPISVEEFESLSS